MQTTPRKTSSDTKHRKEKKDESKKSQDEKLRKSVYTISTPREYVLSKTSPSDIYAQKTNVGAKAPKKVPGISSTATISPMKGLLKSSASSVSQFSRTSETPKKVETKSLYSARSDVKSTHSTRKIETPKKKELFTNVTVNSPLVKRKLDLNSERVELKKASKTKEIGNGEPRRYKEVKSKEVGNGEPNRTKEVANVERDRGERQRTKTRTLDETEVKILTSDNVDNNAGMQNLSKKLVAKPKAFYVDLDEEKAKSAPKKEKSDDEDVSYEDDFESYESDFDSYHSDESEASGGEASEGENEPSDRGERSEPHELSADSSLKEKDEEKMLDSGNFDLRDQRSGRTKPTVMDFILEDVEKHPEDSGKSVEDKRSLDEGFQDMTSSASSMRTVDVLDKPLFIDFTKSKQNKIRRKFNERLKQRAKDLLSMITLHEMTYSLYEMQPISYDLYMATFGRSNYTQSGVQTFEDGITEEVQTEELVVSSKWTQCPVEFSKNDIYQSRDLVRKYSKHTVDYLSKFTFLLEEKYDEIDSHNKDEDYKDNPLRIFFEQKDGVGGDEMLPYENYKSKLKSNDYNPHRLKNFLKKVESKVSRILSKNTGNKELKDVEKSIKLPFSKGHVTISPKSLEKPEYTFLNSSKITKLFFSETKSNLLLTVHRKAKGVDGKKSLLCLWDLGVAREPMKILLAIDNISIGKFRGNTDGVFVAALDDGSIHLWDLSEEPSWRDSVATENKSPELLEVQSESLTQTEQDREWNLTKSKIGVPKLAIVYSSAGAKICYQQKQIKTEISFVGAKKCYKYTKSELKPRLTECQITSFPPISIALQSCSYTNSASNMNATVDADCIVGLELMASQIVSLQRIGILTIWSITQEKKASKDIGKAFWSKMKLEKHQTINITEHIDTTIKDNTNFNLNSAKRRLSQRKQEKSLFKKENPRPKTASKFEFDIDRPYSAASLRKKVLSVEINEPKSWENGIVCNDLKIVNLSNVNSFLVAKNYGEVLCCKKCLGVVRIERFNVATDTSSITSLDVSTAGVPYFLAASDAGTVSLCSLLDNRVLLTLDCRNVPLSNEIVDKCQSDHKGRFVSSVARTLSCDGVLTKLVVKSVHWSRVNHCCIFVLLCDETLIMFDLTHSDINARFVSDKAASHAAHSDHTLALITPEGDVQVHRLTNEDTNKQNLHLFNKYVALL